MRDKLDFFAGELPLVQTKNIKEFLCSCIRDLPDYFFNVAASSSGKYHPEYALGDGGLLRHTRAAVWIANELFSLEMFPFSTEEKDLILTALVLHDGLKHGNREGHTVFEHPLLAAEFVKKQNAESDLLNNYQLQILQGCISSHMGQFNTSRYSKTQLPKPNTKHQKFVHLCDYLASRKFLEVNFTKI